MTQGTILIVDDDKDIVGFITILLTKEQYNVIRAFTGEEALEKLKSSDIHLAILDIMMPKVDGMELCRRIRETNPVPIIMLSAKSSDLDKVLGLSMGADDYMVKPFSSIELIARIKAQLRRYTYLNNKGQESAKS